MLTILSYAQGLVYTLMNLMPSQYQLLSLQAILGLFLEATGHSLPEHSQTVSGSAISRFLNQYNWSTRAVIRAIRADIVAQIKAERPPGRRPILQVILDMTTLEKVGAFQRIRETHPRLQRQTGTTSGCPVHSLGSKATAVGVPGLSWVLGSYHL